VKIVQHLDHAVIWPALGFCCSEGKNCPPFRVDDFR